MFFFKELKKEWGVNMLMTRPMIYMISNDELN